MALEEYIKAYKSGKREYQSRMLRGFLPTLQVLDDIMPPKGSYSEMPLGLVQIPADQIVGTKTEGRSSAFAANFMPILKEESEFARKWDTLCQCHVNEGIRDPIKAYEYMNKFYVEEGNKRVSVMKYYGVVSIPGIVTRIVPRRTEEKENKIYYEYMDFYDVSKVNYIWFSQEGSFEKLQEAVGKKPKEEWSYDDRLDFSSAFSRFTSEYEARGGKKLSITTGDAFLAFVTLYGYDEISKMTINEIKTLISRSWEEFKLMEEDREIELKMDPGQEKKSLFSSILPSSSPKLKIAFIYEKTPASSAWTYAHELGRQHLKQAFSDEVTTIRYDNATQSNVEALIDDAVKAGCNMIFTTTPAFVQASVKAAIAHPDIRILNCSLNTSHRYIRTYYARMHEAKFLMGAIAGAIAENGRMSYIADYPIFGSIANINAFALGAKMVNPRAQVQLEWSTKKDCDVFENIRQNQSVIISGKDMVIPETTSRYFGIYSLENDVPKSLAMPLWHWGKFYEQLIRTIMNGTWKYDDNPSVTKAINYWWGMSAGVIDVICSKHIPVETQKLVKLLKYAISSGEFNPFSGILRSQSGVIQSDPGGSLAPEEIITMDWLAENVIGEIPGEDELTDEARPVILQQGVEQKKG